MEDNDEAGLLPLCSALANSPLPVPGLWRVSGDTSIKALGEMGREVWCLSWLGAE